MVTRSKFIYQRRITKRKNWSKINVYIPITLAVPLHEVRNDIIMKNLLSFKVNNS